MPPVIFVISLLAISLPLAMACWTPLRMRSSRISMSSGSTISFAILIERTSPAPFATTVTLPPPAVDLDRFLLELGLGLGHLLLHLLRLLH